MLRHNPLPEQDELVLQIMGGRVELYLHVFELSSYRHSDPSNTNLTVPMLLNVKFVDA